MDRRKFLAFASGSIVGLAGCSGFQSGESPVRDQDATPEDVDTNSSENDGPTRLGIRDIGFDGRELVVRVSDAVNVTDYVEIQSETGQGTTLQISEKEARGEIVDPRKVSREDIRPVGPGEVTVVLYDDEDEVIEEAVFEYNPELSLNVRPAAGSVYQDAEDPNASALFTFSNSGVGPTYLDSFEVREGENTVPLTETDDFGDDQTTFIRTAEVDGVDSEMFDPVGIDESNEDLLLPQGVPLSFGGDGIFAHIGPEPEATETFEQVFEVVARTKLNREYVFEVTAQFTGGITEASMETTYDTPTYCFEELETSVERIQSP